jgi:tripartite-type tricarboxylate transporter receptor subunit TctC
MIRRQFLAGLGSLPFVLFSRGSFAQGGAWPERPVRVIVPYGSAGSTDAVARFLCDRLGAALGQGFVVENRPGATGTIGTDAVAKSAPDGYTLGVITTNQAANETLQPRRPYQLMRDLAPVAAINVYRHVVAVNPKLPVKDLPGLIAHAKAHPGKLNYASSGPGSIWHVATAALCARAGIEMEHIPYRNYNEARTALVAGQVDVMMDAIFTMLPLVGDGQVRGLATTGPDRSELLPEVPAVAEMLPGYEASLWNGLAAPAGTPGPVIARLNAAVNEILAQPDVVEMQKRQGSEPMRMSPAEFGAFLERQVVQQREWIAAAKVVLD